MLITDKNLQRLYTALFLFVFALIISPWAYFDPTSLNYSYLPRQILLILIMIFAGLIIILCRKVTYKKIFIGFTFLGLGLLHSYINGYHEPHYIYQFLFYEIATLIIFAPAEVKDKMLKYSHYVLYILLAKALYFRMGTYIHGGFLSSNIYATYIVYLCFIEFYKKRYWNFIPSIAVLYFVGSKAAYMAMVVLLVFTLFRYLAKKKLFEDIFENKFKFIFVKKTNLYWSISIAGFLIFIFTTIAVRTDYYINWSIMMAPIKMEVTKINMIMYGLDKSEESQKKRQMLLLEREGHFRDNELSLFEKPLITDVGSSLGLRLTQYDYMHTNITKYFLIGNTVETQMEIYGDNPHSAFIDIVSRLGLLYLVLILTFYSHVFKFMNLVVCNICLIPFLAFQPYGFTIGHSIIILSLVYALSKKAEDQFSVS